MPIKETPIVALEQHLDSLHSWLVFWTAIVVIGLLMEYGPDVLKLLSNKVAEPGLVTFAPMARRPRLVRTKRVILLGLIGGLIVTTGVAGELFVDFFGSKVETNIRDASNTRFLTVQHDLDHSIKDNLELEKALSPRHIPRGWYREVVGPVTTVDSREIERILRSFAGVSIILEWVPDIEALRLANDFAVLAAHVSWPIKAASATACGIAPLDIPDGVSIFTWQPSREHKNLAPLAVSPSPWDELVFGVRKPQSADERAFVAVENTLMEYLRNLDIDNSHLDWNDEFVKPTIPHQPGDICIAVGSRPIEDTIRFLKSEEKLRIQTRHQTQ